MIDEHHKAKYKKRAPKRAKLNKDVDHLIGQVEMPDEGPAATGVTTRVGKGKEMFPEGTDGRSWKARRFCEIYDQITADLGGAEYMSEQERGLVRKSCALLVIGERMEADWLGELGTFNMDSYLSLINAYRRVATTLGLKRKAREIGDSDPGTILDNE